ncbi:putative heat shock protein 70 (hsp70)-interacting protein [Schistosoma mansoni]|uniref:RNA polymerase II-associated protein 3 n=1 Tax=Schistosoma mansoni TaxID=6183 RepID=G4VHQ8_SCHMA|nr:putative heat shock protein 70 (hsp70)-interacting protein [Schistosoma mansoni]|eukprot:XP_018652524.1 putative heat shock protein 70 (hsp70)-interacting protein [Schistosoma mansoni]
MDPEKFLNFQMQMRENNLEVESFLNDFEAWKQTVESKSKQLESKSQPELPAIRNSLLKKHKKKAVKQNVNNKKVERIKSNDYRAWDKFVANEALDDDKHNDHRDVDENSISPNDQDCSSETDEEQEDQRRIQLSKEARELGNVRFKEGKLNEAIEHYTMAIRLSPEDPIPYINRAFAYIKTERYASAEADCTAALRLDRTSVKAFYRRALARKGLGHITGAIEDLKELLRFDPDNKTATNELEALVGKKEVAYISKSPVSCSSIQSGNPRKMRRIPIIEVGSDNHNKNILSTPVQNITKSVCTDDDSSVSNNRYSVLNKDESKNENVSHSTPKISDSLESRNISSSTSTPIVSTNETINCKSDHNFKRQPPLLNMTLHKPPSNWFQLERELRELCQRNSSSNYRPNLSKEAVIYLCNIQPVDYVKLFGENMDSDFLLRMLQAFYLSDQLTNQHIVDRLLFLSKLPRFDIAWMMIDGLERVNIIKFIKNLQNDTSLNEELLKQIYVQYECE